MRLCRIFKIALVLLAFTCLTSGQTKTRVGQRSGPEFWSRVGCEPVEARTKLEALEDRYATSLIKAFTQITTVDIRGVRLDAIDLKDTNSNDRARGIAVVLREGEDVRTTDARAFVDYEEIEKLLNGIETVSVINELSSKFPGFEGRYRTFGDLEISVFRQTPRGTAVRISTGVCEQVTQSMSLDDLAKFKALIIEAKARLDEVK
jgi:hypothetical protein